MLPDPCEAANICASDVLWSLSAFPPKVPVGSPNGTQCFEGYNFYDAAFNTDITWVTDTGIDCAAAPLLCQMPPAGAHYGAKPGGSVAREEDLNGSLVLRRNTYGLRPELYAKVNRTKPAAAGAVDAVLRFDVFCRRDWRFDATCNQEVIYNLFCTTQQAELVPADEPLGEWYCVDYFCGPRYLDRSFTGDVCTSNKCTAAEGFVWPHLIAVSDNGNESAKLTLELEPASYADGWLGEPFDENAVPEKSQTPYQWKVASVGVKVAGSGYRVGDFFTVYFDPAWAVNRKGQPRGFAQRGQTIFPLPAREAECNFPIQWTDKYGLLPYDEVRNQSGAVEYYWCDQRLRVSAVGEGGKITEVEVVPWYQTPQFKPGNCVDVIANQQDKTPTYIFYCRNLCHPVSVAIGGSGYSVGDTITWYCNDPACTTYTPAKGVVTDVDDSGAVLDWHINGSDICMYGYGNWGCSMDNMAVADRPDCSRHPYESTDYLDERGAYKFDGKSLCELSWTGYKPARAAYNSAPDSYQRNTGRLCSVNPTISKQPCRTTFSLTRYRYYSEEYPELAPDGFRPYRYSSPLWLSIDRGTNEGESRQDEMLLKFPPYPPSEAGGAEIALTFGSESQEFNDPTRCESLGGPVQTATVIAGGSGFAFKDKTHSQPILPLSLSELAAAKAEATIANGSVSQVTITKGGYGYSPDIPPDVMFSPPSDGGEAAAGTATVDGDGRVFGITLTNAGSGYGESPTVTIAPPTTGGFGAKLKSFSFSTVSNFPGVNYSQGEPYAASVMRFAYFPVSGVVIDSENRGQGYKVGDTFQIRPVGGGAYTEAWGAGGDDPDSCPNGAWYEGSYSTGLHEDGRLTSSFGGNTMPVGGNESRESFCILKVTGVNQTGGITGLEVVAGGMMFRSQYTSGVKHPEIFPQVSSDTGVGCTFTHTVNTNISSEKFGEVTGVRITDGGHYYANPPSGWMWMMGNVSLGSEIFDPGATMMAHADWKRTPNSSTNPEDMDWVVVMGSPPPVVPKATACLIGECYHALLNRSYLLYRAYNLCPAFEFDKQYNRTASLLQHYITSASLPEAWPAGSWCMLRRKSAQPVYVNDPGGPYYGTAAYMVIEWGQTIGFSASIPTTCPDQTNGRTGITYEYP
jgi:hypothetical protein